MQKLLLSLTVVLASGAYAYAERQMPAGPPSADAGGTAVALPTEAPAQELSSVEPVPPAGQPARPVPPVQPPVAAAAQLPQPPTPPAATASPFPTAAAGPATNDAPPVQVAAIDPPAPLDAGATIASDATAASAVPLPRPRPADAPQAPVDTAQATPGTPQGQYKDGSYKGSSANAYYGRVQVAAVIKGGQIVSVNVLQYPNDRRTSRYINSQALPALQQEVIQAQSATVDTVSGATLTSEAYMQSLGQALAAARGGNA
jgi:uncharacterized protein with FMN-binding domain